MNPVDVYLDARPERVEIKVQNDKKSKISQRQRTGSTFTCLCITVGFSVKYMLK